MPKTYLRHHQRQELSEEKKSIENALTDPVLKAQLGNPGELLKARRTISETLDSQTPQSLTPDQRDKVARREAELRESIREGMPTAEEMRKCPPGAIGKHMAWEKRKKADVLEWKRAKLELEPDNPDPDVASVERLRPRSNTLNMDNALIPGSDVYLPTGQVESKNHASDEDRSRWEAERKGWEAEKASMQAEIERLKADEPAPTSVPCGATHVKPGYETRHIARCGHGACVDYRARKKAEEEASAA